MERASLSHVAGICAFSSAVIPFAFLGLSLFVPIGEWFDVLFLGAPMLLIPLILLKNRHGHRSLLLKSAVVMSLGGFLGFILCLVIVPFHESGTVSDELIFWLLGLTLFTGLGIILGNFEAFPTLRLVAILGTGASLFWIALLGSQILTNAFCPSSLESIVCSRVTSLSNDSGLSVLWIMTHSGYGLWQGLIHFRARNDSVTA